MSMYRWFLSGSALPCNLPAGKENNFSCILNNRSKTVHGYFLSIYVGIFSWNHNDENVQKKTYVYLVEQTAGISHPNNCILHPCQLLLTKCNWTINNSRHWVEKATYYLQTCSGDYTVTLLQKNDLSGQL